MNYPDITNSVKANTKGSLNLAGMEGIEAVVRVENGEIGLSHLPATIDAYVDVKDETVKGIHMSRLFLAASNKLSENIFNEATLKSILKEFLESHDSMSSKSVIRVKYSLPVKRKALKSDHYGWRNYSVSHWGSFDGAEFSLETKCEIIYSSTCPCSAALARQVIQNNFLSQFNGIKEISVEDASSWLEKETSINATPHGQRSRASIWVKNFADPIQIIDKAERALKTPVQAAVKREDEQEFSALNGSNLMFSEDAARILNSIFINSKIKIEHFESLHPHNAVAVSGKGEFHC